MVLDSYEMNLHLCLQLIMFACCSLSQSSEGFIAIFFKKVFQKIRYFCGATDIPSLDF